MQLPWPCLSRDPDMNMTGGTDCAETAAAKRRAKTREDVGRIGELLQKKSATRMKLSRVLLAVLHQ
jgi:hypothetical protein